MYIYIYVHTISVYPHNNVSQSVKVSTHFLNRCTELQNFFFDFNIFAVFNSFQLGLYTIFGVLLISKLKWYIYNIFSLLLIYVLHMLYIHTKSLFHNFQHILFLKICIFFVYRAKKQTTFDALIPLQNICMRK